MAAGGAGEGAVDHRRWWSRGGCGGSAAAAGGAGERMQVGGGCSAAVERGRRGPDLARWDSDRDGGGSRSSVHEI